MQAKEKGFDTDFISTDLHTQNYEGPVYNLPSVVTKMLNCGVTLEEAIEKTTSAPADHFKLNGIGHLKTGYIADISIFKIEDVEQDVVDSIGTTLHCTKEFKMETIILSRGNTSEIFEYSNRK